MTIGSHIVEERERDMTDRIEREIQIEAPIEEVFALVSEPGWWIADGDPAERVVTRVSSDPPHAVSFRGAGPGRDAADGSLVDFLLVERNGATMLRVVESDPAAPHDVEAWGTELTVAKTRAERGTASDV